MNSVHDPAALASLEHRLLSLRPDSERRWGILDVSEMLCHLGDAAESVLARPGGSAGPRRPVLKWLGLVAPFRWPHGRPTLAYVDPRRDGTRPSDFEADRRRAIDGLRAMAAAPAEALPSKHAVFGAMSMRDWHRWAYRHTDHHLRQFGA